MYQLTTSTSIIRIADGASIPNDPANKDYAEYLEWRKTNTPLPIDPLTSQQRRDIVQAKIDNLERGELTPRATRESMLIWAVAEAAKIAVTEPQLYVANLAYKKVKDFDKIIAALRAEKDAIL